MTDKVKSLINKLHELAKRGVDGEKDNAASMLDALLKKHGLTIDDIEKDDVEYHKLTFKFGEEQYMIIRHCTYYVIGTTVDFYGVYKGNRRIKNKVAIKCTLAQFLEIQAMSEFYWNEYLKERELFLHAFIQRNRLFPADVNKVDIDSIEGEEFERLSRVVELSKSIKNNSFHKQLK